MALTYEDLAAVQKETGFVGTEGKCLVLKCDNNFIVYITIQGQRVNLQRITEVVGVKKVQLANAEDLKNQFDALPGCAYPFGFDESVNIYIDPVIYSQEWFLFSPAVPNATIQVRGIDLKMIFDNLPNKVKEVIDFNI